MTLSRQEILSAVRDGLVAVGPPEHVDAVMRRVEKKSRGKRLTVNDYMNLALRESWRLEHGDTAEWDRNAAAAGVRLP